MKLRKYREKLGISFVDAAREIGVSIGQLSRIETGKNIPRPATMERIREWSDGMVLPADFYDNDDKAKA